MSGPRTVVLGRAPDDAALSAELAAELADRGVQAWPAGAQIEADYASGELIRRLVGADALVEITTPALLEWPFAIKTARLARALGRPVVAAMWPSAPERLAAWLLRAEPAATMTCAGPAEAAAQLAAWALPAPDSSPEAVRFAAARVALIEVGVHGGTIGEAATRADVDLPQLHTAAFHLRAIGVIDWSPPLDDATTLIVVS
jgi:hypothetical protein